MSNNIQSVRGMNDCLPEVTDTWQAFEAIVLLLNPITPHISHALCNLLFNFFYC